MKWILVVIVIYVCVACGLLVAMYQPPRVFAGVMSHVPDAAFMVLPFRQLWSVARKGRLNVGDAAPDFSLWTTDKKARVDLSSFRGHKPVVLVFGSYT